MITVWWNKRRDEYLRNIGRPDEADSRNASRESAVAFSISSFAAKVCPCTAKSSISNDNTVTDICKLWVETNVGAGLSLDLANCYLSTFPVFFGTCRSRTGTSFDLVIMYLDMYWTYVLCIPYSSLVSIHAVNIYSSSSAFNFSCDPVSHWSDAFGSLKWSGISS